jgi:UDP:flavonoid glycosyltransferase YjiC (YdhE family)
VCHRWGVDVGRAVIEAAEVDLVACYDRVGVPYNGFDSDVVVDPSPLSLQVPGLPTAQPVRFVGYGGGGRVPPRIPRYGDRPRVLLTVGTVAGPLGGASLVRELTDALLGAGLQVIIAVLAEHRAALGELPDGVVAMESCPLNLLAEQVDLAVHHGGGTTLLNCLEAGLPQLVVPYLGDTLENGVRLEATGAGIRVPFSECKPARIAEGVRALLNDPSYRTHTLRLRDEMWSAPTVSEVAETLVNSVTPAFDGCRS